MGKHTWNSAPSLADAATFRKWVQGVHDAFVAAGWVQSADTGQTDIVSLAVPGTNNTYAGYEVWRLDDTLQATVPIFVKVEYGRGGATTAPLLRLSAGSGTNGSGTLTGVLFAPLSVGNTGVTATEYASYGSGDGSSLCLILWPGFASTPAVAFVLDRSREANGTPNGSGFLISMSGMSSTMKTNVITASGADPTAGCATSIFLGYLSFQVNNLAGSTVSTLSEDGVTAPVVPIPCFGPGVQPWVTPVVVLVHPGDAGVSTLVDVEIGGVTRTYRAFPLFNASAGNVGLVSTATGIGYRCFTAILWED